MKQFWWWGIWACLALASGCSGELGAIDEAPEARDGGDRETDARGETPDRSVPTTEREGAALDGARRGSEVSPAGPGAGECLSERSASRPIPWTCQRLSPSLSWARSMCCGPATITSALAASRGATSVTPDDLRNTIDWMASNLWGPLAWRSNGYDCDTNGTDSDQMVATLRGMANLDARAVTIEWCDLVRALPDHVVIFHGDTQADNSTSTFRSGSSHWLILETVDPRAGVAAVMDPGRSLASMGASRAYTLASVRARFEARGRLAILVDPRPEPSCVPDCAGRQCGADPRCGQSCGACPDDAVCDTSGRCVARCVSGNPCSTGNPCELGSTSCTGGTSRCVRSAFAPAGAPCGAGRACDGRGACGAATCAVGTGDCDGSTANGCETSLRFDVNHCGACGRRCALPSATASCIDGACRVAACSGASRDCDGDASNGCETMSSTDVNHCGACGNRCDLPQATAGCVAGRCVVRACASGAADCDGNAANGCEVLLSSDRFHCGACGRACAASETCRSGACVAAPECTGAQARTCSTGRPGVCAEGSQTCSGDRYGACVARLSATEERCDDRLDNDCDGAVDEGCCVSASSPPTLTSPSDGRRYSVGDPITLRWDVASGCDARPHRVKVRRCLTYGCTDPARDASGALVYDEVLPAGTTRASVSSSRFGAGSYRWVVEAGVPPVAPMYRVFSID